MSSSQIYTAVEYTLIMSDIGSLEVKQNNLSNPPDEQQEPGTPPPEYTQELANGVANEEQILPDVNEWEPPETTVEDTQLENSNQHNMSTSVHSMVTDTTTLQTKPHIVGNQRVSGSTQSGSVIQHLSNEQINELPPQQTATALPDQEEISPWIRVLRLVWPKGARDRRKRLIFVGKFEIILGMYFLFFGISSVVVTHQVYGQFFIPAYAAVGGYGLLLLIAGSSKAFASPSESTVTCNTIFSFICFLGGEGVAVLCLFYLLNIPLLYSERWEFPFILAVAGGTAEMAALICLLHVGCYCKGKDIALERVQIIVSTNTRTGEKFYETVQPQPDYTQRSETPPDFIDQSYAGSSQEMVYHNQQGIPMSNIGRSTSMRTIQNQYIERSNHELPQYFHTVHRHPVTMEQHRQQEMRYATSEFNSTQPIQMGYAEKRPLDQSELVNRQVDFDSPRAMTEVNYPQTRTMLSHQYAQSEIGQPRAMTEVDYPQPQTISRQLVGQSRTTTEVDYPQSQAVLIEQPYAPSEFGQPRTVSHVDYPQRTLPSHPFAQSEMEHAHVMSDIDYQQPRTMPRQHYAQPEMAHPRGTPSRQYTRSEMTQPMARHPQHMAEADYQSSMPHIPISQTVALPDIHETAYLPSMPEMRGPMHPQAEVGYRTVPSHLIQYQAAPSEAGYSYTASESGYPSTQTGRISPRKALAERQMRMEAARQESMMRRQLPPRNGSQQYIVATRQYR